MKIAVFSESFAPVVNGVSVSIALLGEELEARGHDVHYYAPHFPGFEDSSPNVHRLPSIRPRAMPDYPVALPVAGQTFVEFRMLSLDLVHTHTPFMLGLTGLRWAKALGLPLVSTNHTAYTEYVHYARPIPHRPARILMERWMRYYYGNCNRLIVPSAVTGRRLERMGIKTPWRAIPTGISLDGASAESADPRTRLGIDRSARVLLYVGRVAREKNLDTLLEVFRRVREEEPLAHLLIVGGGPYLEECRGHARQLGIESGVTFAGPQPRASLPSIFAASDLFVFPSLTETQGLAVGEASFYSLPSIAMNSGGTPEFVVDGVTGYLIEPDRPEDFVARSLELLQDHEKHRSFAAAAERHAADFTVQKMADSVLEVYSDAMETVL